MKNSSLSIAVQPYPYRSGKTAALLTLLLASTGANTALSADETNAPPIQAAKETAPTKGEKPPPLPLHQIEGNGGIFATLSAYIVNPPRDGEPVGRPSVGFSYVHLGYGRSLEAFTLTESPLKRLELGYGFNNFDLGDLPKAIDDATGISIRDDAVTQHNFNARFQALKEGEFNQKWIPAVTAGVHYKYNDTIGRLSDDLRPALGSAGLGAIGIKDHDSADFTLYASKLITGLPRPVLLEAGGRATKGVWNGLAGYTDDYSFLFEGNVVVFITDRLALAAEYKQQPNDYAPIPGLIKESGDWWTIDAAYVVSKHLTVAAGYGHFGGVLNHDANGVWGITTKWEF